jgi:D-alanyl-D-alanine carboxypeptidase
MLRHAVLTALTSLVACDIHDDRFSRDDARPPERLARDEPAQVAIDELIVAGAPGALVFRTRDHEAAWGSAGLGDRARGAAPGLGDRWRIASVTKLFVATVVMQMVDEKVLELDAPISNYIDSISQPITIRQLLQHTSGLADYHDFDGLDSAAAYVEHRFENPSASDRIALALAHSPIAAPGTEYHYTDTNYRVLEVLVEAVTHRTLAAQIEARILRPLRLADTSFPIDDALIDGPHLHGYMQADLPDAPFGDAASLIDYTEQTLDQTGAAGAMISTAPDLSRFLAALLGGELTSQEALAEMQTTVPVDEDSQALGITGAGLGLESWDLGCGTRWGHGGSTRGYTTLVFASEDGADTGIVVATEDPMPLAAYGPALAAAAAVACR